MANAKDKIGGDFIQFNLAVTDPRLCQGECAGNPVCKAWSYAERGPVCPTPKSTMQANQSPQNTAGYKLN